MTTSTAIPELLVRTAAAPQSPAVGPDTSHRIQELDALRGIAAVAVMLYHFTCRQDLHLGPLLFSVPWGRFGVQLFFIISGYVILMTVRRARSAKEFAVWRAARLYPTFWTACIFTYVCLLLWAPTFNRITPWEALGNLLMVQIRHMHTIEGVYWTLHQEMYFYLIMFVILAIGRARYAQTAMSVAVVTSLFGLRYTEWLSLFLIGMALFDSRGGFKKRHVFFLALAAADIVHRSMTSPSIELSGWQYPVAILVCTLIVLGATRLSLPWLANRVLLFLGGISYPLYLVHASVGYIIIKRFRGIGTESNVSVALTMVIMIGVATAISYGIERPANKAIRRWYREREERRLPATAS